LTLTTTAFSCRTSPLQPFQFPPNWRSTFSIGEHVSKIRLETRAPSSALHNNYLPIWPTIFRAVRSSHFRQCARTSLARRTGVTVSQVAQLSKRNSPTHAKKQTKDRAFGVRQLGFTYGDVIVSEYIYHIDWKFKYLTN
jgi:hypothetical protein